MTHKRFQEIKDKVTELSKDGSCCGQTGDEKLTMLYEMVMAYDQAVELIEKNGYPVNYS